MQRANLKSFQVTVDALLFLVLHKLVFVSDDVSSALIIVCHDKKIGNAFMDQTAYVNLLIRTVFRFR